MRDALRNANDRPNRDALRVQMAVFALLFTAYAYFCPGGGWNQNVRFDQVRSIVEEGTFAINDFLVYRVRPDAAGMPRLTRRRLPEGLPPDRIWLVGNSGDFSLSAEGFGYRVYPGKPPGAVLAAVPAYWLIYHVERWLGVDSDDWWPLTVNAWLTRVLSVGLISAAGGVVFLRLLGRLFPGTTPRARVWATLSLGLGTLVWPLATLFFDHNIVGALLLSAFALIVRSHDDAGQKGDSCGRSPLVAAGALLGAATVTNYVTLISAVILSVYVLLVVRPARRVVCLWAGGIPFAVFLGWYHYACFGNIWTTVNQHEPQMFQTPTLWEGMFGAPSLDIISGLLIRPERGLFFLSPVLVLAVLGGVLAFHRRQRRPEVGACLAVFVAYVIINASFQGWRSAWIGGWSLVPRYLLPGTVLLMIPSVLVFDRWGRLGAGLALSLSAWSFLVMVVAVAVDPQPPVYFGQRPLSQYVLPLARGETIAMTRHGQGGRVGHIEVRGPVSAGPIGVYEGWYYRAYDAGSEQVAWNSFNLGEFIWPGRWASVLPLLVVLTAGVGVLTRWIPQTEK